MKKIKGIFKKLDLRNNVSTVLAIVLECILVWDIILGTIKGVTLANYVCIVVIAMMYVGMSEFNFRRYLNMKNKK